MQDGTKTHSANYPINVLSIDSLRGQRLWPASSPGLNPCNFYLWGNLKNVHSSNPHTFEELTTYVTQLFYQGQ
jgi:hypothetical protein